MLQKALLATAFFVLAEALVCWQCINESSNESCLKKGYPKVCAKNEKSCQNVVRREKFGGMMVTKRCKQKLACRNNLLFLKEVPKNKNLWCSSRKGRSVCRCCCSTNLCNKASIGCRNFFRTTKPMRRTTTQTTPITTTTIPAPITTIPTFIMTTSTTIPTSIMTTSTTITTPFITSTMIPELSTDVTTSSTNASTPSIIDFTTIPRDPPDGNGMPTCSHPGTPFFGNISCSPMQLKNGRFLIETDCEYSCAAGLILDGFSFTTCLAIGNSNAAMFDNPPPLCRRCEMLEPIKNGNFSCSKALDSVCTVECDPGFSPSPIGVNSTTCQADASWTKPIPCCLRSCPPNTFTDIIILLDISASVDERSWELMRNFVLDFIRLFNVDPETSRFSIIRYNDVIDKEYQILLGDFPDDKDSLLKTFAEAPYEAQSHSDTGLALQYALDVGLRTSNGDRKAPNAILVITDSEAYNDETVYVNALSLRAEQITTFVVGVVPALPDRLNMDQLLHLAGSETNFFLLKDGFVGLNENLTTTIAQQLCSANTCESEQRIDERLRNFPP